MHQVESAGWLKILWSLGSKYPEFPLFPVRWLSLIRDSGFRGSYVFLRINALFFIKCKMVILTKRLPKIKSLNSEDERFYVPPISFKSSFNYRSLSYCTLSGFNVAEDAPLCTFTTVQSKDDFLVNFVDFNLSASSVENSITFIQGVRVRRVETTVFCLKLCKEHTLRVRYMNNSL